MSLPRGDPGSTRLSTAGWSNEGDPAAVEAAWNRVGCVAPGTSRRLWTAFEPIHGFVYFVPEASARYDDLGLERIAHYFASRSAPMGAVPHTVVTATFYNFSPGLVQRAMRDAWTSTTPTAVTAARLTAVEEVLRRVWSDIDESHLREAVDLAARASAAADPPGRPLFAGHLSLPEPATDAMRLWHHLTLLREHRGDGHVIALQTAGFGPLDALLTSADYSVLSIDQLEKLRGWREPEWQAAREELRARGWLDESGARTPAGDAARRDMEDLTDELAARPWRQLGDDGAERLHQLLQPLRAAILSGTALPGTY